MSLYRQLLLSTGGGVISGSQQDDQCPAATLAIGLGGTGVACLKNLKKQVYSRLKPDDPDSPVPTYEHIRFLAVDTDKNSLEADGAFNSLDPATEFFDISTSDIQGFLKKAKVLANNPYLKWLKTTDDEQGCKGLEILSASAGAGGVRQIGRCLMIEKSDAFVEKVSQLLTAATTGFPGGVPVHVHIFSGMGGGTGSGTFLDVCYLVQEALSRNALDGSACTLGYFFLPDVNLSVPSVAANVPISKYIKFNGFAAMKELDYCMNFNNNYGEWEQQYKGFKVGPVKDGPVKVCHLISAHSVNNANLENGFDYAMNVVGDFVMQFLTVNQINMESHIANYYQAMSNVYKGAGANYKYCLLGASNATVPMKEITTYLSSRLFEEMAVASQRRPTDQEIAKIAEDNELTYNKLGAAITKGTSYRMPVIEFDYKQFVKGMPEEDQGMPDTLILLDVIMKPYRDKLQSDMINKVEANKRALTNDWSLKEMEKEGDSVSRVCKIFFALREVLCDPERGPFYAADVLRGAQVENLVNLLNGVQKQISHDLNSIRGDISLTMQSVKSCRYEFLHMNAMARLVPGAEKKKFEEFMAAVARYFTDDSHIKVLEQMEVMVRRMIEQFNALYESHFAIYESVSKNLLDTFHENYQTLSADQLTDAIADPFVVPLMRISDLREQLDDSVAAMKLDMQERQFNEYLFNRPGEWIAGDESKICRSVSSYLTGVFKDYTSKTLTDYLEMRFGTTDPIKLSNSVYNDILMPLSDKADALFWKASGYSVESASPIGYISMPDTASAIIDASKKLTSVRSELRACESKMKDRIFFLRCLCGVPMFAYNGTVTFYQEYCEGKIVGKHLYEYTPRDPRDWRKLFNLQPFSTINDPDEETQKAEKIYIRAIEKGLIRQSPQNPQDYQMVIYPPIDGIKATAEEALGGDARGKVVDAIKELDQYIASREIERIMAIPNDGSLGHEETVREDHVVASNEMIEALRLELEKMDELDKLKEKLIIKRDSEDVLQRYKQNFFNALYSGVIQVKPPKVVYLEEKFGITKEVALSDANMEPYGRYVPLYQAFVTYVGMDNAGRDMIDDQVDKRLGDTSVSGQAMKESCGKLIETFSDRYMGLMQQQAQSIPEKTKEIEDFLIEFRGGIDGFMVMYGL